MEAIHSNASRDGHGPASPDYIMVMPHYRNPGTAAVLSALIPGIGQFYNGDFLRGIFWLIVTPGLWLGTGGLFGWIFHVIAAITAYTRAQKKNRELGSAGQP
jgi:TM2 domain-containing membrane protein YozV